MKPIHASKLKAQSVRSRVVHKTETFYIDQILILQLLSRTDSLKFGEILISFKNSTSDNLAYHLRMLKSDKLIDKSSDKSYTLTDKGKEIVGRLDFTAYTVKRQPKVHVVALCRKKVQNKMYYLVHKRLKHPSYGYLSFPSAKVQTKQFLSEAVKQSLFDNQGIIGNPEFKMIKQVHVQLEGSEEIVEDKIFNCFLFYNIRGKLKSKCDDGENFWMTLEEIKKFEPKFYELVEDCTLFDTEGIIFRECVQIYTSL